METPDLLLKLKTDAVIKAIKDSFPRGKLRSSDSRRNIGEKNNRSQVFGILPLRCFGVGMSSFSSKYPLIFEAGMELGKYLCDPLGVKYTAFTLNESCLTTKHRDKNNIGPTLIVGFGEYSGGSLMVDNDGTDTSVDIKLKPYVMEASKITHWTSAFEGTRYSIVFFKPRWPKKVAAHYDTLSFQDLAKEVKKESA